MADVNVYLTHHKHLSSGSLNLANLNVYWAIHSTRFQYFRIDFANFSLRSTTAPLPHLVKFWLPAANQSTAGPGTVP